MLRKQPFLLVSCLLLFPAACGSGSGGGTGGTGTGGHGQGTGGSGSGGQAGGKADAAGTGGSASGGQAGSKADAAGTGGSASGGQAGGSDASIGDVALEAAGGSLGDASVDGGTLTTEQTRGQYLVKSVLNCSGCHTPSLSGGGGPDNSKFLAGNDCFTKDTATGGCLASANLTNDTTGLKNLTDQQIKDAFTKGIDPDHPDGSVQYLFAQMPYYQFATLTDSDAQAIVAYLRTVPGVSHEPAANGGPFATQPTAPQWLPVALSDLPAGAHDAGTGVDNGKYLSALMCVTCHTVNTASTAPLQINAAMAFLGGKEYTTTLTVAVDGGASDGGGSDGGGTTSVSKKIQSSNLTPDPTGLASWSVQQIVTAIKTGKDEGGRSICSPMRPFPNLTDQDATDIANYLKAIPPVANALSETCE